MQAQDLCSFDRVADMNPGFWSDPGPYLEKV